MEVEESRAPLDASVVRAALDVTGWTGPAPLLLPAVPTLDRLASAVVGRPPGSTAVAEQVGSGSAPLPPVPVGAALWVSTVVEVASGADVHPGWLPLVASLAAVDALRSAARVPAELLWPDVLTVPGAMCGGDAGSRTIGAVGIQDGVVTVGILVSPGKLELPAGTTSVYADGGDIDRAALLAALLGALRLRLQQWHDGDPALALAYRDRCQTLGRLVVVDGAQGRVKAVDTEGRLVVDVDGSPRTVPAAGPLPELV